MADNGLTPEDYEIILPVFLESGRGYLAGFREGLRRLEDGRADTQCLASMHRAVHSLKGAALQIGFESMSQVARGMEEAIEALRKERPLPPSGLARLDEGVDFLLRQLTEIESRRQPESSPAELLTALAAFRE
jgi:chemotaxis protein histidine kinase CheA